MTTVLLVDDHRLVRAGLAALLAGSDDIEVVGEAADGQQAIDLAAQLHPDATLHWVARPCHAHQTPSQTDDHLWPYATRAY